MATHLVRIWAVRVGRRREVRVATALLALAAIVATLVVAASDLEKRRASGRATFFRASGRKAKANLYRQQQVADRKALDGLRRAEATANDPRWIDRLLNCTEPTPRERIDYLSELEVWEGRMASIFDWASAHPSESLPPGPPRPTLKTLNRLMMGGQSMMNPAIQRDAGQPVARVGKETE